MESNRVARVAVDVPLAHLDRPFDYRVPDELADQAVTGARVRVRFAGRQRDGFILELTDDSERAELSPLLTVVSPEPVLTPQVAQLVRAVADHYAGSFSDVVRLAVPPRHGVTEKAAPPDHPTPDLERREPSTLAGYPAGEGFLAALAQGRPRAAWTPVPRTDGLGDWQAGLLEAAATTLQGGRGAILVVPDQHDLDALAERAAARFGRGSFVSLSAELGPAARYRAFLAVLRGQVRLVLGTRSAVFAPVGNLGLVALWDDGDDSYAEARAPYPHAREVAVLRAHQAGCALLLAARGRTAEVQRLVETGWLHPIELAPAAARAVCAAVRAAPDDQRLPRQVFATIRDGLTSGPVLVSVPRAGYQPLVVCDRCRAVARCPRCSQGLLRTPAGLTCPWCGPPLPSWRCPECGSTQVRTPVAGVARTAEEFGKAFPGASVLHSTGEKRIDRIDDRPAIVLATPGVEPVAAFGYTAAVLLDTGVTLRRPDLRAGEEALRRWLAVAALVRPAADGGTVLAVGETTDRQLQALLRLDPVGAAERELAERREAGLPPALKLVMLEGDYRVLTEALGKLALPGQATSQGPFPVLGQDSELARLTLRCPLPVTAELLGSVRALLAQRSASKAEGAIRVRVDPHVMG
ncbi:MAG: hypothetical protein VB080_01705 [Propionicimonas sp.]|uniref:primosomal protein N' family DNA-binding protein n=1 Tax=Propionicimonas sp. TaxID=1955623 RepID=UPI002B1FD9D2|nr:hypothetical protein [Propionicimonas sp.]MEA4943132.1 hypothetical protein [Propionicimonas sp.]